MKNIFYRILISIFLLTGQITTASAGKAEFLEQPDLKPESCKTTNLISIDEKYAPPTKSLGSVGVCFACAATYLRQYYYCKKRNFDCKQLPPKNMISVFGMLPYRRIDQGYKNSISYTELSFEGGSTTTVLLHQKDQTSFLSERCWPFDKYANSGRTEEFTESVVDYLKDFYNKNNKVHGFSNSVVNYAKKLYDVFNKETEKTSSNQDNVDCPACEEIKEKLLLSELNSRDLTVALEEKTFKRFFYRLTHNDSCLVNTFLPLPNRIEHYPKEYEHGVTKLNIEEFSKNIKDNINNGPIAIEALCVVRDDRTKQCYVDPKTNEKLTHAFVILKYETRCGCNNQSENVCEEWILIDPCWGEEWFTLGKAGGWVKLDKVYKEIITDKDGVYRRVLAWIK